LFKSYSGEKPMAVINNDDEMVRQLAGQLEIPVYTFGSRAGSDLELKEVELSEYGTQFDVLWRGQRYQVESHLLGRFNVSNLLAAITTLLALGFEMEELLPPLAEVPPVKGRMEPLPTETPFRVLIDYAHTDDALLQLLKALQEITVGRLTVIFGCGGDRDTGKRPLMGAHAMKNADLVVLTSDNPRTEPPEAIIDDVIAGINDVEDPRAQLHVEVDRTTAIKWTLDQALSGDVIVLAGKGHEPYQDVGGVKHPYDEPAIVLEHLEKST
jgi:UDP-N-acetylmuramoyl-L-alanyl-D-glutamate--2,6-diaminopimelate ligase